jgi:periplasmic divalent cation tolerance protein
VTTSTDAIVIYSTAPSRDVAEKLARGLVDARLAACVQILDGALSIYSWKSDVHADRETQLVIKTRATLLGAVDAWIREHHPYETPEVIAVPVVGGSDAYLAWLRDTTATP